ncbi:protein DpdH [Micromonospora aurantiaca (nom. illeg.)]|uniref:protein DpdH n=1 Tax=Micromonospora aurantiaca (nom. illeg.) TaxID=47850 RepID=UPI0037950D34
MSDFRQHLCWSPLTAGHTINTEAVSPSRAVFFATHAPLRIRRRHPEGRADARTTEVTEEQVWQDFLNRPTANGVLLMPVVGESGAGKSHLVRWIHEKTPDTPTRSVIYLPKTSTSLRAVVRTLLDKPDIDSPELAQLRADVDRMSTELDQAALERRLINELSEAVSTADPKPGIARMLAGPHRLAAVLLDPYIRDYLLQPGKLIPRLAAALLSDQHDGLNDRPTHFTVDDLPLDVADINLASDKARQVLGHLYGKPELQVPAAEILTEQLPAAVTAAWNLGGGRLQDAMLEIRRQYARQGKELLLLIEDFVVLQGVQRDLLDALIEVGVRDGHTVLAPVRTLMAVTPGYFGRLTETVLTRAKAATPYIYDLDIRFDVSERGQTEVAAFVGRYLNAARVGRERLEEAGVGAGADVPNQCDDCPYKQPCHSTFGVSTAGHGLYPFNWPALRRAIRARPAHNSPDSFNPRAVIGEVIRPVLVEHAEALAAGTFPDARFREDYPTATWSGETFLYGAIKTQIDELDPTGSERRQTFLEYWGDAPQELVNLPPNLHHAFGISLLDLAERPDRIIRGLQRRPSGRSAAGRAAPYPSGVDALPARVRKMVDDLENWQGGGGQLLQGTALELRTIIKQAVVSQCAWNEPVMAEPLVTQLEKAWPPRSIVVSIEDAEGEGMVGTSDAPIKFKRSPRNATFFQQLLLAANGVTAGNSGAIRRLHRIASRHQRDLQRAVLRARSFSDEDLVTAMRASLLGAVLAGRAWPDMASPALLDAVLDDGASWKRSDVDGCVAPWVALWEAHRAARLELVARLRESVGYRRGTRGDVRMVDAARAMPLLARAAEEWTWRPERLPEWVAKEAVAGFAKFADLVEAQAVRLREDLADIRRGLPAGVSGSDTVTAVEQALDDALREGLGPDDLTAFRTLVEAARHCDWRRVDRLERHLNQIESQADADVRYRATLRLVTAYRGDDLRVIRRFLTASDAWLTQQLATAQRRAGGSGAIAAVRVQDSLRRWGALGGGAQ